MMQFFILVVSFNTAIVRLNQFIGHLSEWLYNNNWVLAHESKIKLMVITSRPSPDLPEVCLNGAALEWCNSVNGVAPEWCNSVNGAALEWCNSVNGVAPEWCNSVKYLGMVIDNKLAFDSHIALPCLKLSKVRV